MAAPLQEAGSGAQAYCTTGEAQSHSAAQRPVAALATTLLPALAFA
jgi:hypothetical protein